MRNEEKNTSLKSKYPLIRIVKGDLADSELLQVEAANSDIVIHCASIEDLGSSQAIAQGLKNRTRSGPAFWIATSGTDNLAWKTIQNNSYGEQTPDIYDDEENLGKVLDLPDSAPHNDVERAQRAAISDRVKLAIVSPPCIYGTGRGPGNKRSVQLPDLAKFTLQNGAAFQINNGRNRWQNVHIQDLSDLFVLLIDEALKGGGIATWGREGYYFAENGTHLWGDISKAVAKTAAEQGYIASPNVITWTAEEADAKLEFANLFYGTDTVCRALKARRVLGWHPHRHDIETEIKYTLEKEAEAIGKAPAHV